MSKPSPKVAVNPIFLDLPSVATYISMSQTSVQKLVRENNFPKPRMLSGRRVAWLVREVDEWAEKLPVSDLLPPPNTGHSNRPHAISSRDTATQAPPVAETAA
jgi:prophage regulatory protein